MLNNTSSVLGDRGHSHSETHTVSQTLNFTEAESP